MRCDERPMAGVRVVELGMWVAAPAAACVLADWGADVVKVEPPAGDPMRQFFGMVAGITVDETPLFDQDNRGKRSVIVDVRTADGVTTLDALLAEADVFVTNLRLPALTAWRMDPESVLARWPRLVYGLITGYGRHGPDASRAAYDMGAFWSRSGLARASAPLGQPPSHLRPGVGDHITAMNLVAGISAALVRRGRTGRGGLVETSLLRSGAYCLGADLAMQLRWGMTTGTPMRSDAAALMNCYRAGDGGWFWLLGLESDRHWPALVSALGNPPWSSEDRFASGAGRHENCAVLVGHLDAVFATQPVSYWTSRFDEFGVWWAPVQDEAEVVADPQAVAAGCFTEVPAGGAAGRHTAVATPVDFDGAPIAPVTGVPALGGDADLLDRALRRPAPAG